MISVKLEKHYILNWVVLETVKTLLTNVIHCCGKTAKLTDMTQPVFNQLTNLRITRSSFVKFLVTSQAFTCRGQIESKQNFSERTRNM